MLCYISYVKEFIFTIPENYTAIIEGGEVKVKIPVLVDIPKLNVAYSENGDKIETKEMILTKNRRLHLQL